MIKKFLLLIILLQSKCLAQVPVYLEYPEVVKQLKVWNKRYPDITQLACIGYSAQHNPIYCFRICQYNNQKKVLTIAAIHGNEKLATSMCLGYIGYILYHKDEADISAIIHTRDLYFIPACSPDSYIRHVREVEGVDPNRNFKASKPCAPVYAIKALLEDIKPQVAISIHTFGREYLIPYGDKREATPNDADYKKIIGHMADISKYKMIYCHQLYGQPIFGAEVDYFYRNKIFAIVAEVGTNQEKSQWSEIQNEFYRTWRAYLYFLQEAPLITVK